MFAEVKPKPDAKRKHSRGALRAHPLQARQLHATSIDFTDLKVERSGLVSKHLPLIHQHNLTPTNNYGVDAPEAAASAPELVRRGIFSSTTIARPHALCQLRGLTSCHPRSQ